MKNISPELLNLFNSKNKYIDLEQKIDWDNDDVFGVGEDISNYTLSAKISKKIEGNFGINVVDNATVVLDNSAGNFSPKNQSGDWSGNIIPERYSIIKAGLENDKVPLFDGYIQDINLNYNNTKATLKLKDLVKMLQETDCPKKFYKNYRIEEIFAEWLDRVGINYTVSSLGTTVTEITDSFEGQKMWQAMIGLANSVWGDIYIDNGTFFFKTKLSPSYDGETSPVDTLDGDNDYFDIAENYNTKDLFNEVKVVAKPLIKQPRQPIWTGTQDKVVIQEEYNSDVIVDNQLQLTYVPEGETTEQPTKNVPIVDNTMSILDITIGKTYSVDNGAISVNQQTGLITFVNDTEYPTPTNSTLRVKYEQYANRLTANQTKDFIIRLDNPAVNIEPMNVLARYIGTENEVAVADTLKTAVVGYNEVKEFEIKKPQTVNWEFSYEKGIVADSGSFVVNSGDEGTYKVTVAINDLDVNYYITDSTGTRVVDKTYNSLTVIEFVYGKNNIEGRVSYDSGDTNDLDVVNSDLEVNTFVYPDRKKIKCEITNKTSETIKLYGYINDKNNTADNIVLMGRPYKRTEIMETTRIDKKSQESYGVKILPTIENNFISSQQDLDKLAEYLLYRYSTPRSALKVKLLGKAQYELGDKLTIIHHDMDIDNDFILTGINYDFKDGELITAVDLVQAYASDWNYTPSGTPVLTEGTRDEDKYTIPNQVTGLNAQLISSSMNGDNKAKLTWDKHNNPNISHYNIFKREDIQSIGSHFKTINNPTTHFIDNTLVFDSSYYYSITAVDKYGNESEVSPEVNISIKDNTTPSTAMFDVASCYFKDDVLLKWNSIVEAELYEVRLDTNFGVNDSNLVYRSNELSTKFFPQIRNYTFYIKTINNNGVYSSGYDSITLENAAPPQPTPPIITEFFEGLWIELQNVVDDDIKGYRFYVTDKETDTTSTFDVATAQRLSFEAESGKTFDIQISAFDSLGEGALSNVVTATTRSIDDINQLGLQFQPPEIVDVLPALPNSAYPEGKTVFLTTDNTLYKNISGVWDSSLSDNEYQKILVGIVEAGAIGVDHLQAESITASAIGTNEIITNIANINDAVVDELRVQSIKAGDITVGSESTFEDGYNPTVVEQNAINYANNVAKAQDKMRLKPEGAILFHFDGNITSTDGVEAEII